MRRLEARLGVFVAAWCALLCANDLLPYLGGRDDSCQTMFSGLDWDGSWNNHFFVPQRPVLDSWVYLRGMHVEIEPARPSSERVDFLLEWLNRPQRRLNVDAVRAVVHQVCEGGHRVRMRYRDAEGPHELANACESELGAPAWWVPVRLYETDLPDDREASPR